MGSKWFGSFPDGSLNASSRLLPSSTRNCAEQIELTLERVVPPFFDQDAVRAKKFGKDIPTFKLKTIRLANR